VRRSTTLAALVASGAAWGIARRHHRLAAVAPQLRRPPLYIPMSLRNDTALRIARGLIAKAPPERLAPGVIQRTAQIPAGDWHPDVPVVVYERVGRVGPSGALLWIHGGGLVMGTPAQGNALCSRFAAELGIVVVSVDYRLAPEHPFPAGLEDCYAALAWVHEQAESLGLDTTKIAVGGDSAGGGLAACLAQLAHDRAGPSICLQLLQYPMLDDRTALRSDLDAVVWTNASNRYAWSAYLGHRVDDTEHRPYSSAARRDDLSDLPPAWIGIGAIDLFHDESIAYADRLRAAGVPCELHVVPGMYHAAEKFAPSAPSMVSMLDSMTSALATAATV
jgi:acetyl esterase/lipase